MSAPPTTGFEWRPSDLYPAPTCLLRPAAIPASDLRTAVVSPRRRGTTWSRDSYSAGRFGRIRNSPKRRTHQSRLCRRTARRSRYSRREPLSRYHFRRGRQAVSPLRAFFARPSLSAANKNWNVTRIRDHPSQ